MNANLSKLLEVLDQETACYQEMQMILDEEEASMSLSKRTRFERAQMEKEVLVGKIQGHEKKRRKLVDSLAVGYQIDQNAVTVTKLAQALSQPENEKLLSRAVRLRSCIKTVQQKNRRNRQFINHYLDLIKGALKLLTHQIDDNAIYHKPGAGHPAMGYARGAGRIFCGTV